MDVRCPACAARYTANDEKLRGKTARMRCKSCGTVWLVQGPGAGTNAVLATPIPSGSPVSIPPPAAEPKRAAVVKRGAEREVRDLFANAATEELGAVKETLLPPPSSLPPPSFGMNGTGARNETSVLFRVDQLTARHPATPPATAADAPKPLVAVAEDEGIIDLQALSARGSAAASRPPVAPLFSEPPPPVTMDVGRPAAPPPSPKAMIFAALAGAAMLALVGTGIALAFRGEEPKPVAARVAEPPPAPPPAVTAPPPAPAETASTSSDDGAKETRATAKKGGKGRKGGKITNHSPVPAAKAAPKSDPCGCHGDFNCILACSAKGK